MRPAPALEPAPPEPPAAAAPHRLRSERAQARIAWTLIGLGFLVFCAFVVTIPLGVARYRDQALSARGATLDVIGGVVLIQQQPDGREVVAANRLALVEGNRIRTTADAQALISLFDGSTIRLWPETTLTIRRLRSSTYNQNMIDVEILQSDGHARVEVGPPTSRARAFAWRTPHADAQLREGSYRVEVAPGRSELSVRAGSASVGAGGQGVEVLRHERTVVSAGGAPERPGPAARNLVANGDFPQGFAGWQRGSRNEEDGVAGSTYLEAEDGRPVVRFRRRGSQRHGETYLHQAINRDVTDDQTLRLTLDVKLIAQTLSGGGWLGSEYPLLARVRYRDANGNENTFVRGFYFRNDEGRPTLNGVQVLPNQWVPHTADLFDPNIAAPRPAYVLWIELEGSGWEFESLVAGVQLIAE